MRLIILSGNFISHSISEINILYSHEHNSNTVDSGL